MRPALPRSLTLLLCAAALVSCRADGPVADEVVYDLPYVADATAEQLVDLHLPAGDGPHPVLLWLHGGGWVSGDHNQDSPIWYRFADRYAVVSADYRLAPGHRWPAQADDVAAALEWTVANAGTYGLDADRIVLAGFSAGGHLAAWTGVTTDVAVRGVVVLGGPTDLRVALDVEAPLDTLPIDVLLDCEPAACRDRAAGASPATEADPADPPVFVQHGTDDEIVPLTVAEAFVDDLRAAGTTVEFEVIDGMDHDYRFTDAMLAFLDRALG